VLFSRSEAAPQSKAPYKLHSSVAISERSWLRSSPQGNSSIIGSMQSEGIFRLHALDDKGLDYFLPATAVTHLPYSSSKCVAYSSGFDAAPVPWKPTPEEVVRP
jgi:hypothetical protein